ncbi:MAG: IS3 family transposase, partial [Flavobacteriales bacterium]|nr:IS3 family transposase [Flavobacteriales bacterium]
DNAVAESFFKSLKCELVYGCKLLTASEMELEIFEYIECWYNKVRRHSALGNLTIDEFWNNIKTIDNYKKVA